MGTGKKPAMLALLVIVVVIVIAVAYMIWQGSSSSAASSSPLYKTFSSSHFDASDAVTAVQQIAGMVNGTSELNVSYSGSASVRGTYGGSVSVNIPVNLSMSYAKYGTNYMFAFGASGNIFGHSFNQSSYGYSINGTQYSCTKSSTNGSISCMRAISSSFNLTKLSSINSTVLAELNSVVGFSNSHASTASYNGQPCVLFSSNVSVSISNLTRIANQASSVPTATSSGSANGFASGCFSSTYGLPLNLTLSIYASNLNVSGANVSGSGTISLHETALSTSVNPAYVDTLPGPVINSSIGVVSSGLP